ncbi:radical SAM peptide maturase, CXXX-repeat target family [Ruminiclostridium hungatei]|uniref:radical SAM peptide maturase, CXXX-repeat target family n=1 Tax=Ruminiclostridium hungatei TaxID=48256 RepID=UPI001F6236CC|nr:radical SAM peptide maturase, CXXX-repeat target family [Ruminiclostridium hungatei]
MVNLNNDPTILMGKLSPAWNDGTAKSITFCVTEDCNLACKYCYMTGKNDKIKMSFETARKAVDYILTNPAEFPEPSVVFDFIGGEPFMEIELIDRICDYIKRQMYLLEHPWFNSYRFSFSTNGLLYHTDKVQEYILKNKNHLSIGMSVDGNKMKHDLQRIRPNGGGSYDDVVKNVPLWLEQFPGSSTKATFSHDDLPYLKDSIISLWELGIKIVAANVVFEDVWEEGDDSVFEEQLKGLADYIIENKLWKDYSVRFFDPNIGHPLTEEDKQRNYCGAGRMLAIDCKGNFFPCIRFYDFSLNNRKGPVIGDIHKGIDSDRIRPFLGLTLKAQSRAECVDCEVASGCGWCQGCNYDLAETATIYQRATYLCKIHKATVRSCEYFWNSFERATGLISERTIIGRTRENRNSEIPAKYMQFITSDNITPHCSYRNTKGTGNLMSQATYEKGMEFCLKNGFIPVLLGRPPFMKDELPDNCLSIEDAQSGANTSIAVHDNTAAASSGTSAISILIVNRENLERLYDFAASLYFQYRRVNLVLEDIEHWSDKETESYSRQLDKLLPFIAGTYKKGDPFELSVLSDIWELNTMRNCEAGQSSFALAPNGRIYLCPAFYFEDEDNYAGTPEQGIHMKNPQLMELCNAPICSACDVYSCRRCKQLNIKLTGEINTPSRIQCLVSHIERNKSMELQKLLMENSQAKFDNLLKAIDYIDPLDKILRKGSAANA